jgi:hypothetical protein
MNFKKLVALMATVAVSQSFAIFGLGGQYSMSTGSLEASDENIASVNLDGQTYDVGFTQSEANPQNGFGFKFWIDILPIIDVEANFNMHFGTYSSAFVIPTLDEEGNVVQTEFPIELDLGVPFTSGKKAKPLFSDMQADVSIYYPFFEFPMGQLHIGGGASYMISTPVINADLGKTMWNSLGGVDPANTDLDQIKEFVEKVATSMAEEGFTTGMGGHVMGGIRISPPILPFAVFANGKYYFGGAYHEQFTPGAVVEVGGALAF